MITLPNINISFKQLANTLVKRSERAIVGLIIKDIKEGALEFAKYKNLRELEEDKIKYTEDNYQAILDVLQFGVAEVNIFNATDVAASLKLVEKKLKTCWLGIVEATAEEAVALVSFIKEKEFLQMTYKACVYNALNADSKHIVNFVNTNVVFKDKRAKQAGDKLIPSLLGLLASANVERGVTYRVLENLLEVTEVADNDDALNEGKFILINEDNKVKVGLGINSLVTFNENNSEDMRYIDIVEAMDLIVDDVRAVFKNDYLGKIKNKYDNQVLFISGINTYFKTLAKEDILDEEYKNIASVNIEAQRQAWIESKPEAENWSDEEILIRTYKRNVYLSGDIKILGAMENLKFNITIF